MMIIVTNTSLAQSIYRCEAGGKTTYSDRPCAAGTMRKISPDGQPTAEQRAAARTRLQLQLDQDAAKQQERRALELARAQAAAERRASLPPPVYEDPRDNQKQLVHSQSGWDYKTPKQIRAEEAARAAWAATQPPAPPAPPATFHDQTGRLWLNQGGTALDPVTGRRCVQAGNQLVSCF